MAQGEIDLHEVHVSHPTLRLRRRRDGTWNIQGLLVYPWPGPWLERSPPILIQNGRVELSEEDAESPAESEKAAAASAAALIVGSGKGAGPTAERASPLAGLSPPQLPSRPGRGPAILHDLTLKIEPAGKFLYTFEGTARGDAFDRIIVKGAFDLSTGCLELRGELTGLTLSQALCRRVPCEARPALRALALNGGVVDIELSRFRYDPNAAAAKRVAYGAVARLRDGVWDCPKLPFSINDLSALVRVENDLLTIERHRVQWPDDRER